MDVNEKIQQRIKRQEELIKKVEGSMGLVPEQQRSAQEASLKLMKEELALFTETPKEQPKSSELRSSGYRIV